MEKCFEYIIGLLDGMAGYCKSPATIQHTTYISMLYTKIYNKNHTENM